MSNAMDNNASAWMDTMREHCMSLGITADQFSAWAQSTRHREARTKQATEIMELHDVARSLVTRDEDLCASPTDEAKLEARLDALSGLAEDCRAEANAPWSAWLQPVQDIVDAWIDEDLRRQLGTLAWDRKE